jgi:hypothetical protein
MRASHESGSPWSSRQDARARAPRGAMGERPALWTRERAVVAGIGGFGALFAAG